MTIGEKIKEARLQKGMTQQELAEILGYKSRSSINKIEIGDRDIPRSLIVKFAKALNVSPAYLMDWVTEQDEWTKAFCESVDEQLAISDSADIHDSGVNYRRLSEIASGVNNLSLSEACDIADELGCSLDAMVGKEPPEDTPSSRRLKEFIELFAQLTEEQQKMLIMQMKGLLSNE